MPRSGALFLSAAFTFAALSLAGLASAQQPADTECELCRENTIADLQKIIDAGRTETFGEVANAYAKKYKADHLALLKKRGCGTLIGSHYYGDPPAGMKPPPHKTDCTQYLADVLKQAFAAQGRSADWQRVISTALRTSGSTGLRGTELQRAFQTELGWKGLFWAKDTSSDTDARFSNARQKKTGVYFGVKVDPAHSIVDYQKEGADPEKNANLAALRKVPFAILDADAGEHMALVLNGVVYEVHWAAGCDDDNIVQATPLEKWNWNGGAIVLPPEDAARVWGTP